MILFVCETYAQLINAINIKESFFRNKRADICYFDTNGKQGNLVNRIKNSKIFDTVFYHQTVPNENQSPLEMIKKAFKRLNEKRNWPNIYNFGDQIYDAVFIAGPDMTVVQIYHYLKSININVKLCLYEEGVFEYYIFDFKKNHTRRQYSRLIYGEYYLDRCDEIYLYNPNLLSSKPDGVCAYAIPQIRDSELKDKLNYIFNYQNEGLDVLKCTKYVYLEQSFASVEENDMQRTLITEIISVVGAQNLIIKLHPASNINKYDDMQMRTIKTVYPMEILLMNNDFENVRFMSISSSSLFNLFLIFGMSSKLYILYKLFEGVTIDPSILNYIDRVVEKYSKNSVIVPCTIDECLQCLKEDNIG